jgi:hypothetical protein
VSPGACSGGRDCLCPSAIPTHHTNTLQQTIPLNQNNPPNPPANIS